MLYYNDRIYDFNSVFGLWFSLSKIYVLNILNTVSIYESSAWSYLCFNYVSMCIAEPIVYGFESREG